MSDLGAMNRDADDRRDAVVPERGDDRTGGLARGAAMGATDDSANDEEVSVTEHREAVPVEVNEADWLDSATEPTPDPDEHR